MINTDIHAWPYPDLEMRFYAGDHKWREVDEKIYDDQLGALFPAKMEGSCFMVGEPLDHDHIGAIAAVYIGYNGRYFARYDHLINFNPNKYWMEIKIQLEEA